MKDHTRLCSCALWIHIQSLGCYFQCWDWDQGPDECSQALCLELYHPPTHDSEFAIRVSARESWWEQSNQKGENLYASPECRRYFFTSHYIPFYVWKDKTKFKNACYVAQNRRYSSRMTNFWFHILMSMYQSLPWLLELVILLFVNKGNVHTVTLGSQRRFC